ncbi:hypothetical protein HOG27_02415 [bacterium]|nr:hypothetical protein [bacterium]
MYKSILFSFDNFNNCFTISSKISTVCIAALMSQVCPSMSQLAKFITVKS